MPEPVVVPVPSQTAPVVEPAAPVVAPAIPAVADPASPPIEAAKPGEPAKPADAPKAVPEKYDFTTVKMPKGIELNADLVEAISPVFRKLCLSQEAANELVQTHAEAVAKAEVAGEAKREADFKEFMKTTVANNQAALTKEWGAETAAKLAIAQAGMAKVVSPKMKARLDDTGLGSDPEFVKAFYQVGMMTREDVPPNTGTPAIAGKSHAQVLYGNTNTSQNH